VLYGKINLQKNVNEDKMSYYKSCITDHAYLPTHFFPFPVYPGLHAHL